MEIGEFTTFFSQSINVRRLIALSAKTTNVSIPHVIHEDDNDVRLGGSSRQ
jgi:hypothetical protein